MEKEENKKPSSMESHVKTIIEGLALVGIMFVLNSAVKTQSDVRLVVQSVKYLEKQIETAAGNRYTESDADKDNKIQASRMDNFDYRLNTLEQRVDNLEIMR